MKSLRTYVLNTSWLVGQSSITTLLTSLVGLLVVRHLGPEDFGTLSYALSLTALFAVFANLGLENVLVREMTQKPAEAGRLLGSAIGLKLGVSFLLTVAALLTVLLGQELSSPIAERVQVIVCFSIVLTSLNILPSYFYYKVAAKRLALAQFVYSATSSCIKLALIASDAELVWFAIAYVLDGVINCVLLLRAYIRTRREIPSAAGDRTEWLQFSLATAFYILTQSWPLIISSSVIMFYMKIDQVMINAFEGPYAVGQYAAAARISETLYFLPVIINHSFFPAVIDAREHSQAEYEHLLSRLFSFMIWTAVLIAGATTLIAEDLIRILLGPAYDQSASVLIVHVWAAVFIFVNNTLWRWHLLERNLGLANVRLVLGLIVNVGLNYVMIPRYGILGAAWATLIARAVVGFFSLALLRETRPIFWLVIRSVYLDSFRANGARRQ